MLAQKLLGQQLKPLGHDLANLPPAELELARKLGQLTIISGLGLTIFIIVVADGFVLVEIERHLVSCAGLDMVQQQSGLSTHAERF